jgi:hypothetical protein
MAMLFAAMKILRTKLTIPATGMKVPVKALLVPAPIHAYLEETLVLVLTRWEDEGGLGQTLDTCIAYRPKTPTSAFRGSNRQPMLREPLLRRWVIRLGAPNTRNLLIAATLAKWLWVFLF